LVNQNLKQLLATLIRGAITSIKGQNASI